MSAGRSCFVRCRGCYNFFGNNEKLTSTGSIINFLEQLPDGIEKITVGGGDPLSRPDIADLLVGIKDLGLSIYMDTVGTPLLGDTESIFYGTNLIPQVNPGDISPYVDLLGIALDGSTNDIMSKFRTGRSSIHDDQMDVLRITEDYDIPVCVNTVVNSHNIHDLYKMYDQISNYSNILEWQLFQFMPIGPLGYKNRNDFIVDDIEFANVMKSLVDELNDSDITLNPKSRIERKGRYLLIDTDGVAWYPNVSEYDAWSSHHDENKERVIIGNINNDYDVPYILESIQS